MKTEELEEKKGIQTIKVTISRIQLGWFKLYLKSMIFVELEDM
jgi:hypothetical protein